MENQSFKRLMIAILILAMVVISNIYANVPYPYASGQAVFVQSPYNSSLYTNYTYNPYESAPQRLPVYTTNQAVFVQQPYATAQQTVSSYPTTYSNTLPYTENRYMSPSAYPTTVAPAFPYGNVGLAPSSPYITTSQGTNYRFPYTGKDYTTTYTYPYTTSAQTIAYPPPVIDRVPSAYTSYGSPVPGVGIAPSGTMTQSVQGYPTTTYNAYPVSTVVKYPYPTTTTGVPEIIVQPVEPAHSVTPARP